MYRVGIWLWGGFGEVDVQKQLDAGEDIGNFALLGAAFMQVG